MRRLTLIRCGVASVLLGGVVAAGVLAAGCGGGGNGSSSSENDSGSDVTQPPPGDDGSSPGDDGSTTTNPDAGGDADAAPAPVQGKLILVHASAFALPLRFCFGSVNIPAGSDAGTITITPNYAAPNTALGVPPGTGGAAAASPTDLKDRTLEIYAINASAIAGQIPSDAGTELKCDQLIGATALASNDGGLGLMAGKDYFDLGTLPAGTLADGTTTLLAVTGCAPGQTDPDDKLVECPSGYDPQTGDLGMWTTKLDTTTVLDGGAIGAQFAYASYPFSFSSGAAGGVGTSAVAGFYVNTTFVPDAGAPADGGDAGDAAIEAAAPVTVPVPFPIAAGVTYGQLAPATGVFPVSGVTFDGTSGFFVDSVAADGGATPLKVALSLPNIQALSAPGADAGIFANGSGYVFVLVGDPNQPSFTIPDGGDAGQFNFLSAHILGFPTNPPFGN